MNAVLWSFVFAQMLMGGFDTLYHHEGTERLAWRPGQRIELTLHGVRNLAYSVMFGMLGWCEPRGGWAVGLIALMAGELLITLWDFVEEDRTRRLPATERVLHTLLTLNYGVILALLVPWLWGLAGQPTELAPAFYGLISWFCAIAAAGVIVSGVRDLAAARRCARLTSIPAAELAQAIGGRRHVLVTGGTGFVGTRLVGALAAAGHEVTVLTRKRGTAAALGEAGPVRIVTTLDAIPDNLRIDAIVNLAGEPISDTPWTRAKRIRILRSRVGVTREVIRLIERLEHRPEVLVSGSAIGWYGLRGDQPLGEAAWGVKCFSRRICVAWEHAARPAEALGVRTVLLRIGLVFDRDGGMLARLLTPFEFGLGGRFGDGRHWMSWIHRDDLVRLVCHCIASPALQGPVNATAPRAVTNRAFTAALGRALNRPALVPIPAAPLQLALGDFAKELLLGGQRVVPAAAIASGFEFRYPEIDGALQAICATPPPRPKRAVRVAPAPMLEGSLLR